MIRLSGLRLELSSDEAELTEKVKKIIGTEPRSCRLYKKAVDARKKSDVHFVCSVVFSSENEAKILHRVNGAMPFDDTLYEYPIPDILPQKRPVVIGSGPAGSFAALCLARAGVRPLILERGKPVAERKKDTQRFFETGLLDPESNVQFGEGGAGTFSDGKLNTGTNSPYIRRILSEYVSFGAPEKILTEAKPHIGTDTLCRVAEAMRSEIERLGGTYRFGAKVTDIAVTNGAVTAVYAGEWIETDTVILAIGHSARDTFGMLLKNGVAMTQKPFSVGLRIEHPQELIDRAQYGSFAGHPALGAADYKFGEECYTFCMCPGGYVVAAASEEGGIVTNGMSNTARDGENANSALLVNVDSRDFGSDVFAGVEFQRVIEKRAYEAGTGYAAPCQTLSDFVSGISKSPFGAVKPTYRPGVVRADIHSILPGRVCDSICRGIASIDRKLTGFAYGDALLTAPETRSSSPVRIVRDDTLLTAVGIRGLYPCGEGAGYAGGIMSAAADGIRCASRAIGQWKK